MASRRAVEEYGTPREAFIALTGDVKFICDARRTARAAASSHSEPVYRYVFTHVLDNATVQARALSSGSGARRASGRRWPQQRQRRAPGVGST
ncbi:hypothetical protein [Sorangium sp. So ce887]|uniref:hypothetical protein n=1 Tax=Sorangium sp. So ce887 TaxID=3133324 RepID=UPI003F5FE97B